MATDIKRLNFFTGQFLEAQDFQDEQHYHIEMRRRLNRLLYSPGVVDNGFEVTKTGDKRIRVGTGFAIDGTGSELFIITPQEKDISGFAANAVVYVALHYAEATLDADKRTSDKENISGFIRITESPDIKFLANLPSGDQVGMDILIAKLQLDASGNIQSIETSQRLMANLRIGSNRLGIGTFTPGAKLQIDGANDKTDTIAAESQWLRMRNTVINKANAKWGITWDSADSVSPQAYIMANADYTKNYDTSLVFGTRDANANTSERMRITASGNVGIGVTSPAQKLTIAGQHNAGKDPDSGMTYGGQLAIKGNAPQLDFIDTDTTNAKDWSIHVNSNKMYFVREPWTTDLVLDGAGKLGIGTDTPGAKLEITGTLSATQNEETLIGLKIAPTFQDGGKTGIKRWTLDVAGVENTPNQISLQLKSGNISNNFDSNQITFGYNNTAQYRHAIKTRHHSGQKLGNAIDFYVWNYSTETGAADKIGGLHTLTLDGGNVGIGISSPSSILHIDKGRVNITSSDNTGGGGNRFDGLYDRTINGRSQLVLSSNYSDLVIASSQANNNHGSTLTFVTYNTDNTRTTEYRKWVINQGNWGDRKQFLDFGYKDANDVKNPHDCISADNTVLTLDGVNKCVGIGINNPKQKLVIAGNSPAKDPDSKMTGAGQLAIKGTSPQIDFIDTDNNNWSIHVNSNKMYFIREPWNYTDLVLDGAGNVGIGTDQPKVPLHIRQSAPNQGILIEEVDAKGKSTARYMHIAYEGQGNIHFYQQNNLGQWMDINGNWNKNSDLILKEDISGLPNMLDKVLQLNPVQFRWKADHTRDYGFIAQEVEKIFPEFVNNTVLPQEPATKVKGLSYSHFGIISIAAIKELKEYFDQQLAILDEKLEKISK